MAAAAAAFICDRAPVPDCRRMNGTGDEMETRDGWFAAKGLGSKGVDVEPSWSPTI